MTQNYKKHCWYCGSQDIEEKGSYVQCCRCGASWNDLPELAASPVTEKRNYALSPKGSRAVKNGSPSGYITWRAAKARQAPSK